MDLDTGSLLVVDDNEMNRDMLSRRLERRGHKVTVAGNGAETLQLIKQSKFDLVLLDVMMPGIDGLEVLKTLRQSHSQTELPIIMATAKGGREDIVEALKLGANDYVTKPLDFPVVLARVRTQLQLKRSVDQIIELSKNLDRKNRELAESNERMKRDLDSAARVQRSLLPASAPSVSGIGFAWKYEPCDELGGDILNIIRLDDGHVLLYLLDVSGHGVPAALLSVTLSRVLTMVAGQPSLVCHRSSDSNGIEPTPPGELAAELNRRFQSDEQSDQYFTLFYAVLNLRTRGLSFVCAGHPGPIYLSRNAEPQIMTRPAHAIGWFIESEYQASHLRLKDGDRLYIFSDGVSEAMNGNREQFEQHRIARAVLDGREDKLDETLTGVLAAAKHWSGGRFDDDVSALAIEIHGPSARIATQ